MQEEESKRLAIQFFESAGYTVNAIPTADANNEMRADLIATRDQEALVI